MKKVPHPNSVIVKLPFSLKKTVLAVGPELKTTFAILRKDNVFISDVFDDLKKPQVFEDLKKAILNKKKEFEFDPNIIACDLHPEYISTKFAKEIFEKAKKRKKKIYLFEIQHHHAHIASCMAENGLCGKVIGVAFDGTGYGSDGNMWGGEFLLADYSSFNRQAHLAYVPMPGADKVVLEPARMAFSYLYKTYKKSINRLRLGVLKKIGKAKYSLFAEMIDKNINSPLTSSAGRLFDAVSSLVGIKDCIVYEGEAAIELERIAATDCDDIYEFKIRETPDEMIIEFWPMIKEIVFDLKKRKPLGLISRKFHNTLAEAIRKTCYILRKKTKLNDVVLSGGVFQNRILLSEAKKRLESAGFSVYTHLKTSSSDRSLSLGQAVIAASKREKVTKSPGHKVTRNYDNRL
jgi:hydrogenase maturation protein HypF